MRNVNWPKWIIVGLLCLCAYLGWSVRQLQEVRVRAVVNQLEMVHYDVRLFANFAEFLATCDPERRQFPLFVARDSIQRASLDGGNIGVVTQQQVDWAHSNWEFVANCLDFVVDRGKGQAFSESDREVILSLVKDARGFNEELLNFLTSKRSLKFATTGVIPKELNDALVLRSTQITKTVMDYLHSKTSLE